MLRSLQELERYTVGATDGELGSVVDFLIDDEQWAIRYLVVETGGLLNGREVLISPISFRDVDWYKQRFNVALTKDKVAKSPSIDLDKPVSRQHEYEYQNYYGYPYYWGATGLWGVGALPGPLAEGRHPDEVPAVAGDVHLRSVNELRKYHIQGSDAGIGHVDDFIVDDATWRLPYMVVDTSNWWFGRKVLVAPQWASRVSWAERSVYLNMPREVIKNSPAWDPEAPINRSYEERLYDFYGRPVYWATPPKPAASPMRPMPMPSVPRH